MIDPAGPLPPAVYWRRRALAVALSVGAVVLLAWILGRGRRHPAGSARPLALAATATTAAAVPGSGDPARRGERSARLPGRPATAAAPGDRERRPGALP